MISTDEHHELTKDASALAYQMMKFSGLYRDLSGAEWDALANSLAAKIVAYVEGLVEQQRQQVDAFVAHFRNKDTNAT